MLIRADGNMVIAVKLSFFFVALQRGGRVEAGREGGKGENQTRRNYVGFSTGFIG